VEVAFRTESYLFLSPPCRVIQNGIPTGAMPSTLPLPPLFVVARIGGFLRERTSFFFFSPKRVAEGPAADRRVTFGFDRFFSLKQRLEIASRESGLFHFPPPFEE